MIEIPEDPIDVIIHRVKHFLHRFALSLMDEGEIIRLGNMSNQPNEIEQLGIYYEWLPNETILRRGAAQYRSSLRNGRRMMVLYFTEASKHLRRATRRASNR